jgi:hypothetical protein
VPVGNGLNGPLMLFSYRIISLKPQLFCITIATGGSVLSIIVLLVRPICRFRVYGEAKTGSLQSDTGVGSLIFIVLR